MASIPLSDGTVAVDDGSTPDVLTFNSLFVPDPQFTVIKDIFSPVKLIDVKIGGTWVALEELGIADLVLEVSLTDSTKAKEKVGKISFFDPDGALTESEIISEGVELRIGLGFLGDVRNFGTWALEEVSPQLGEDSLTIQCGLKPKSVFWMMKSAPASSCRRERCLAASHFFRAWAWRTSGCSKRATTKSMISSPVGIQKTPCSLNAKTSAFWPSSFLTSAMDRNSSICSS